jgi:general secretion pathway protein I
LRPPPRRADQRGFTLIEVLVALAVTTLVLVVVLRLLSNGLGGSRRAEAYTEATLLAESTLDSLGVVNSLADGDTAELSDGRFRIRTAVDRYQPPDAPVGDQQYLVLYRLSVTVSWHEARQERAVSLSTLRLGLQH